MGFSLLPIFTCAPPTLRRGGGGGGDMCVSRTTHLDFNLTYADLSSDLTLDDSL